MQPIYGKYLAALRAFGQNSAPEALSAEEAQEVLRLAHINRTAGIVCYVYLSHPELVPASLLPGMRRLCYADIELYSQRSSRMKLLMEKMSQQQIDCLLFKGLVVREYYPVPELRTFGDIDFVIRTTDREKSDALMKELGYNPETSWEPVYSYRKENEHYEIHTDVMEIDVSDKADYKTYFSHIWEHVQPSTLVDYPHMWEFTPEYHLMYLLTHIAKHISGSGASIRMYLDIALFANHFGSTLNWQQIAEELNTLCLSDFANVVFTAAERWFGVPSPLELRPVPEQVLADFLDFTLEGGVYGYVGRDKSIVFLKQQSRSTEEVSKTKTLLFHAFPPVSSLENRFTYLQKHRWLLPVAWVHRLVSSRKEWGRFADHTKKIITADTEEAQKLKQIYKELGL